MRFKLIRQRVVQEVLHVEIDDEDLARFKENPDEWEYDMELQGEELATDMYGEPIGYSYPIDKIELLPVLDQLAAIKVPLFVCDSSSAPHLYKAGCEEMVYDEGDICEKCSPQLPANSGVPS